YYQGRSSTSWLAAKGSPSPRVKRSMREAVRQLIIQHLRRFALSACLSKTLRSRQKRPLHSGPPTPRLALTRARRKGEPPTRASRTISIFRVLQLRGARHHTCAGTQKDGSRFLWNALTAARSDILCVLTNWRSQSNACAWLSRRRSTMVASR